MNKSDFSKELVLGLGTNLGNKFDNLFLAKKKLSVFFELLEVSPIFQSAPIGPQDQGDFLNQVLSFKLPSLAPIEVLEIIISIEKEMGRVRKEKWGPRIIDIDILFWDKEIVDLPDLKVPHPHWCQRSFVVKPLQHLHFYKKIKSCYNIPDTFEVEAHIVDSN
jgi:2-amino-4-hydroxy-6-hydroxymethyldihydropteridine diphosphokinase